MRRALRTLAVAALLFAGPVPSWAASPLQIVAAENFYGDLAQQIGGPAVSVTSILSNPDEDPHLFESSPSTARTLATADIVLYNGADYDPWMEKLLAASTAPARTAIVAADVTGKKSGDNPHLWYDPATLPAVAAALASELEKRDPANATAYAANLQKFLAAFTDATKGIAAVKAAYAGTPVTATEPVFGYMAGAMGFTMLNMGFQISTMNDTEPSPGDVAGFEDSLRNGSVKILFYNSQVTDDTTARLLDLAKAGHIPVVGVSETEPAGATIETWLSGEIAAVQAALAGHP